MIRLRLVRLMSGITQADLARKVGCYQTDISKYESGKTRPGPRVLAAIAEVFHVSYENLLDEMDSQAPRGKRWPDEKERKGGSNAVD